MKLKSSRHGDEKVDKKKNWNETVKPDLWYNRMNNDCEFPNSGVSSYLNRLFVPKNYFLQYYKCDGVCVKYVLAH